MKKMLGKRFMFLVALLVGLLVPSVVAQTPTNSTFNVVSLNVEGVPQMLKNGLGYDKAVNQHAIGSIGTKILGQKVAMQSWDIIGLCEDYNYHDELLEGIKGNSTQLSYYGSNANNAKLQSGNSQNDTYGLNLLVNKRLGTGNSNVAPIVQYKWTNPSSVNDGNRLLYANVADYSNDELSLTGDSWAHRGYFLYEVTLPNSCKVDVFVLHMDAGEDTESSHKNTIARNNQLKNLANAIVNRASTASRPMIVMGMTNSLYTREQLKTGFIDVVNANANLTINDVWVELIRGGKYPVYNTENETPGNLYFNDQNGEVVNKIFFVNDSRSAYELKANSYFRDVENFASLRNSPVVASFTAVKKNATLTNGVWTVTNALQNVYTSDDFLGAAAPKNGKSTEGFLMNIGSGLYLKAGAQWATQAAEGSAAMPVTIENADDIFTIKTLCGSVFRASNDQIFMDNTTNNTWTFEQVKNAEGTGINQYYIYNRADGVDWALTSTGGTGNVISGAPLDRTNSRQKWIILTKDATLLGNIASKASPMFPFDVTPFIVPGADFDAKNESEFKNWTDKGFVFHGGGNGNPADYATLIYNWKTQGDARSAISVSSSSSINMPVGNYTVSFEGVYRARAYEYNILSERGNRNYELDIKVSMSSSSTTTLGSANVMCDNNIGLGDGDKDTYNRLFRENDDYKNAFGFHLNSSAVLTFKFDKPSFTAGQDSYGDELRRFWMGFDNIVIKNLGTNSDAIKIMIANYLYETAQKVRLLNVAGQAAYDVSDVISRYNSNTLSIDGRAEIAMIDAAYEIALKAHNAAKIEDSLNDETNPGDVTDLIVNPSFEANGGSMFGWTQAAAREWMDVNCVAGGETGIHGTHRFNAWCAGPSVTPVKQTIKGIKNGLYELKALVTSDPGNSVYIIGNNYHKGAVAQSADKFIEVSLMFLVEDGTATIGAVGGYNGYYYPTGSWYKADNFRLRYVCDLAHGRVYLAHQEASAVLETFDNAGKDYANVTNTADTRLGELLTAYKNANQGNITSLANSNGVAEAAAIYDALTQAALQQKAVGSDMTWCLGDPSFELGKYKSVWSTTSGWETKVAMQTDLAFAAVGVEGNYLFNTWNDHADANNSGINAPVKKEIKGLPNGTYRLTAKVSSDNGNTVFLFGNTSKSSVVVSEVPKIENKLQEITDAVNFTPNGKKGSSTIDDGTISYETTDGTYSTNPSRIVLESGKSLKINAVAKAGETLKITSVVITYRGGTSTGSFWKKWTLYYGDGLTGTADGKSDGVVVGSASNTGDNSNGGTITINDLNASEFVIKNKQGAARNLEITGIKVEYKREYYANVQTGVMLEAKQLMHDISLDFEVTNGTATIGVVGGKGTTYNSNGGCWYKVDDFHLKLLFPKEDNQQSKTLYLSENATYMPDVDFSRDAQSRSQYGNIYGYSKVIVERTLTYGSWGTLVLPFDLQIAKLGDGKWDVRELSESENETDDVVVTFTTPANGIIKAGKCYIVRHNDQNLSTIEVDVDNQTTFITTADYFDTSCGAEGNNQMVEFIGTYTRGYVPVGSFFINSKNQFKEVVKANTNKIKGFRGYFTVKSEAKGRALSFRLGEGTGVDSANNGEVTVVAIYNLQGMRLNDMEPGINILQMSDGSSVKVLIK